jgi:hypothetical protein
LSAVVAAVASGHPAVYDVLVGLHVVTAVIGFGAVAVSGAYGAIARNPGGGPDEVRRFFRSRLLPEYLLLVAPVFGLAAMSVRPGGGEFGDLWAIAGIVIWVVAGGLLTAVVRPAERRIRAAGTDLSGARPDATRLMWAAAGSDLLFVIALFVMVTQPR